MNLTEKILANITKASGWEDKRPDGKTVLVIDYDDSPTTKALRRQVEKHKAEDRESEGGTFSICKYCITIHPCTFIKEVAKDLGIEGAMG